MIDLAELRRAAGVTQVQLADVLATTQGQISRSRGRTTCCCRR